MTAARDRKTVTVMLRVPVACDVEVGPPNEDGQAYVYRVSLASRGNMEAMSLIDPAALDECEYAEIDAEAAKVFGKEADHG